MKPQIAFDEFAKVEVRVGTIVEATTPEGSEKLIKFEVDFGDDPTSPEASRGQGKRIVFAGIRQWYTPEELLGVKTVWVTNIPPKRTPFGESQGMLFACDTKDGEPYILRVGDEVENGSVFH